MLWLIGPSVALAIAGTLALSYNRSRIFFSCCILAFCLWLRATHLDLGFVELVILGIAPLNIAAICFFQERGTWTINGLARLSLLTIQMVFVVYLVDTGYMPNEKLLDPFSDPLASILVYLPYHQLTGLLLTVSAIACLIMGTMARICWREASSGTIPP